MKDLVLLISTCDKYSDLWDKHIELLNTNWDYRDIEVFLVTDKKRETVYDGVSVFSAGDEVEMPQRISMFLDSISSKYVLYVQDDYFPIFKISNAKIKRAIEVMEKTNADYLRLFHYPKGKKKVNEFKGFHYLALDRTYDVNLYPGIWKVDFFKKVLKQDVDIWRLETSLTGFAKSNNAICIMSTNKEYPFLDVVEKGKLHYYAKKYFEKNGIISNRQKMTFWDEMYFKITFYSRSLVPKKMFIFIKKVLKKIGYHFYSDDF